MESEFISGTPSTAVDCTPRVPRRYKRILLNNRSLVWITNRILSEYFSFEVNASFRNKCSTLPNFPETIFPKNLLAPPHLEM